MGKTISRVWTTGTEFSGGTAQFRHCHVLGCSLAVNAHMRQAVLAVAETVKAGGGTVSFDPNIRPELLGAGQTDSGLSSLLAMADIVLPSGTEARLLTGADDDDEACRRLLRGGARIVALKQGDRGCLVYSDDGAFDSPGFEVVAVDPTGAGDCFDAGFVAGFLEGRSLQETARLASAMGALGATRRGPMEGALPRAYLERFVDQGNVARPVDVARRVG